jgi:hypothetical protein
MPPTTTKSPSEQRPSPPAPKPYLTRNQLCELVGAWTPRTISHLIERGVFRKGEHFFVDPRGRGYLFRWDRILDVIELGAGQPASASQNTDEIPMLAGGLLGDGTRKGNAHGL